MHYITVKLTEDQALTTINALENKMRYSYEAGEAYAVNKDNAFLRRIINKLAKAKNE